MVYEGYPASYQGSGTGLSFAAWVSLSLGGARPYVACRGYGDCPRFYRQSHIVQFGFELLTAFGTLASARFLPTWQITCAKNTRSIRCPRPRSNRQSHSDMVFRAFGDHDGNPRCFTSPLWKARVALRDVQGRMTFEG